MVESDFFMSVKTFSALAAAELMAVLALDTKDASIFSAERAWGMILRRITKSTPCGPESEEIKETMKVLTELQNVSTVNCVFLSFLYSLINTPLINNNNNYCQKFKSKQ